MNDSHKEVTDGTLPGQGREPHASAAPEPLNPVQKWTLFVVALGTFMLMLDVTAATIAVKQIGEAFEAPFASLQWVVDSYTLTLAVFLLASGALADRWGRKKVFLFGLLLFSATSALIGFAPNIEVLNWARAAQGIGGAVLYAVGPALIAHEFRGPQRGMAFGVIGGVAGLAIAVGPLVGGLLTSAGGWRWIFFLNIPAGLAALAITQKFVRESQHPQDHGVDWLGVGTFGVGVALPVFALLRGDGELFGVSRAGAIVFGAVALLGFVWVELRKEKKALFDLSLFRVSTFSGVSFGTLLSNAAVVSAIFLQLLYMQSALGLSAWETGLRFVPQTLTVFVVAGVTGSVLMTKLSPRVLLASAIACIAAGIWLAMLVTPEGSWLRLLPSMLVTGIGMGLFNPPRAALTVGVVEPQHAGMANGMGETFQQVGVAIGIAAFGAMFHEAAVVALQGGADITPALAHRLIIEGPAVLSEGTTVSITAEAVREAFVGAFREVMLVSGAVCSVGALIAAWFVRTEDLHASALEAGGPPSDDALEGESITDQPAPAAL